MLTHHHSLTLYSVEMLGKILAFPAFWMCLRVSLKATLSSNLVPMEARKCVCVVGGEYIYILEEYGDGVSMQRPEEVIVCLSLSLSILGFETGSLTELEAHQFS